MIPASGGELRARSAARSTGHKLRVKASRSSMLRSRNTVLPCCSAASHRLRMLGIHSCSTSHIVLNNSLVEGAVVAPAGASERFPPRPAHLPLRREPEMNPKRQIDQNNLGGAGHSFRN